MTYRDALQSLSSNSERVLSQLAERYLAGAITLDTLADVAGPLLAAANVRGWQLGQLSLAGYIATVTGQPGPAPVPPPNHYATPHRLSSAVYTAMDQGIASEELRDYGLMRIKRLARSEPVEAAQRSYSAAMQRSSRVRGWVRSVEPDGCQLCQWWSREGRVWPAEHPMPTHKGCMCEQIPVMRERIQSTQHTRALAHDRRVAANTEYYRRQQQDLQSREAAQ